MKRKIPIPLIIAGILFFIFKDFFFRSEPKKSNFKFPSTKEMPATLYKNSIQSIDTSQILNNLCERPVTKIPASNGLDIKNFVPCSWEENFATEKQGAVTAYSKKDRNGIIEMGLLINNLAHTISLQQRKDFFSIQSLKRAAEEVNAISYRKSSISGLDCHELIFKKDNLAEMPGVTFYAIHFETIFKTKFITLTYGVANKDSTQSKKVFYQYLPVFRILSQKFKISN